MKPIDSNATRLSALRAACILLFAAVAAFGQVNLTAGRTNVTLPDGTLVPMWGYSCGTAVSGSTTTCAALNPNAGTAAVFTPAVPAWSPVVITVPTGTNLSISLTNNLSVPTSLVIVGQLGGGLGTSATSDASPDHSGAQANVTWPTAGPPATAGTPPAQGNRVRSMATEVNANGGSKTLTWTAPRPGTYLIESGTHPSIQGPMGLYGILVVTAAPAGTTAGTSYPGVTYNTEIPLLFGEIDPVQNVAVDTAVATTGFSENTVWTGGPNGCGAHYTCYPPAVNYSPLYYTINGVAFNKTSPANSVFSASIGTAAAPVTGNLLVRLVNAGLRMHVPAIVGSTTGTPATPGLGLIAEDGNPLPGKIRVQNEVFMAAGKTYDVMINVPAAGAAALPVFDRQLSLSGNAVARDAGMLAYIGVNSAVAPAATGLGAATARADTYNSLVAGHTLTVADASRGLIANDTNVYGVHLLTQATNGIVGLNADGTFTYTPNTGSSATSDSFTYCANGSVIPPAGTPGAKCSSGITTTVTLGAATLESASGITCSAPAYASNVATSLSIAPPGVLSFCKDAAGYPLTVNPASVTATGIALSVDPSGGFNATVPSAGTYTFTFKPQNSQGVVATGATTATLTFPAPTGLSVKVVDGSDKTTVISDYRWIIEEDRTFFIDPNCTGNPLPAGCPTVTPQGAPPVYGANFHTSYMPVVAAGCTGTLSCESGQTVLGQPAVCDLGNGVCRPDTTQSGKTPVLPSSVHLDPTKRYYISVLPGDAAQPFIAGYGGAPDCSPAGMTAGHCGHGMGGAPIAAAQTSVTVLSQPSPYPPATLSVFVYEDDYPLNGEHNAGGGIDVLSPNEPGLGGFQILLADAAGGTGDSTGQPTYDMFNQPLANSLDGTIDAQTKLNACPISKAGQGIAGMIITCPKYESDGVTLSPLAGQAIIKNLYPGRYGVIANPGADRSGRGEEWLQTNTLDGQKAHDSFLRVGEPGYFQEFGPAGYHVSIGFANPKIINDRKKDLCAAITCTNEVKGHVTTARMSRTPDERLYGSGDRSSFAFTQCYASLGDPDGAEFAFVKCDADGNFDFTGIPAGNWKLSLFDQWNDQIVDGISTPVGLAGQTGAVLDMGEVAAHQWQANIYTRTFIDVNGDGVSQDSEPGLALVNTNVRFPDGSFSNLNSTDLNGYAGFNEVFPLFNWYVVETDATRYKSTGTHVVYDAGGAADGTTGGGTSTIAAHYANTVDANPLPADLSVPGAVYCATADCTGASIAGGPVPSSTTNHSTGRIDPPWVQTFGWQGFSGQNNFLEFGKKPYVPGENGGIRGHVIYASTRPFDDPQFNTQNVWEPMVPNVTVNLYKKGFAADGVTPTLTLVDTTLTSSFDAWAQGFRSDGKPNMNCPGQSAADPFFYGMQNQPNLLDWYNSQHGGNPVTPLPYQSQYKCYDGMHNWNQLQPAPYDGMFLFPSVKGINPTTGNTTGTNCTICGKNTDASDPYRYGKEDMLPAGKYVVEVVPPPGYEIVKEEDKNILIGDNYIAPVTQQFGGLGNVFILPDQAEIAANYNPNNPLNATNSQGRAQNLTSHEGDTATRDTFWPCVGATRTVPDFISLFPQSQQAAPFAGAVRNLCDRKEVTLDDQTSSVADFFVWTETHVASKFTGVILDDFDAEFDPFSPQFGEKFAPAYLPVSVKDWAGNEVMRTHADEFGLYNGLNYSTWEVNPPNPTGYGPTMMVMCMNDPGTGTTPDPLYQPGFSNFCYELPFMPGATGYFDTPVVPTSAFAGGYNHPDCAYPDATPAIAEVDGDGVGPWVSAAGKTLTITALGDQAVENYGYAGPSATTSPYNQKKVTRHYGFGATQGTGKVTIGGVNAPVTGWSDTTITVTVPSTVPSCAVQQQAQYGGSAAKCGQLVITAANGRQSIDAVTVTVGGKVPTHVAATGSIQAAIDAANPGDLIIVDPTCTATSGPAACTITGQTHTPVAHQEMLLMWKPVRLQGVGAVSSVIDANPHPAGRLDPWRRQVVCLFGLGLNGTPISGTNPFDPNATFSCTPSMQFSVDRLPLEATVGWTAVLNGNLAEQLIEPSLMGAYEGAGITVLAKGVKFPTTDPAVIWASDVFPTGTQLLTSGDCGPNTATSKNPYPSNYFCNPSSIDGLSIVNSSQGGGGIDVHGWGHNIQIANNRIHSNQGTLSGGITVGQGEHPDAYLAGSVANTIPGSCESSNVTNLALPYCFDLHVNIHNNAVTLNSSLGDELFSSTPAGAGGVTVCNGSDYYQFNYNWVCGNMSTGDGAGVAHLGFTKNGDIEHNTILFNQSTNPSITTNGGGLLVMGAPDQDPPCAATNDNDCLSPPNTITPSDGTGPGLLINANLILGNSADAGTGGGLRLQHINGNDVLNFPNGATACTSIVPLSNPQKCNWNSVTVTNNIITNNVAGWDGGGVSLQDALAVDITNNTIASNDSTASAGPLFGSLFAPLASTPGVNCNNATNDQACPQVAGLVSVTNSPVLVANLPATGKSCPPNHGTTGNTGSCFAYSVPLLSNNVLWQNRSFVVGVGGYGTGGTNQQKTIALYNSAFNNTTSTSQAASQTATGACPAGSSYWDIGVRGDLGPANHNGGLLAPKYSVLTDAADYPGANNLGSSPALVSQYCNGSRVPPEAGSMMYMVIPGTNETNALPTPVFSLTPSATVDEGNNWVNLRWGPLALTNPVNNTVLANYTLAAGSPAIDLIPTTVAHPTTDFYGNPRPDPASPTKFDAGAVEFQGAGTSAIASVTGGPLAFGNVPTGTTSAAQTLTLHNTGTATLTGVTLAFSSPLYTRPAGTAGGTCTATLAAAATCTINVVFSPTAAGLVNATLTITGSATVTGSPVALSGTGVAPVIAATLTPTTWTVSQTRNCPGTGVLGILACAVDPAQIFTLRNTGNVPLTGIAQGVLGGVNASEFGVARVLSNCGPTGNGQVLGPNVTLAPNATCTITVQFKPLTTQSTGVKNATISVTDAAGTQTSTLTGTAN